MQKSSFKLENKLISEGYNFIIGIDEAGRGPLAGPVVACATTVRKSEIRNPKSQTNPKSQIPNPKFLDLIRDSKTLSHKQRERLFDFIHEHFYVGVGICDHRTIDRMNIMQATFLAMKKAVAELLRNFPHPSLRATLSQWERGRGEGGKTKCVVLLDGNKPIPNFSGEQKAIVNGDRLIKSISAASIVAKVTRDRIMIKMHKRYPEYHFHKHKGYGTKLHLRKLKKHGPCKIHRRSFAPVKQLAKKRKQ